MTPTSTPAGTLRRRNQRVAGTATSSIPRKATTNTSPLSPLTGIRLVITGSHLSRAHYSRVSGQARRFTPSAVGEYNEDPDRLEKV